MTLEEAINIIKQEAILQDLGARLEKLGDGLEQNTEVKSD